MRAGSSVALALVSVLVTARVAEAQRPAQSVAATAQFDRGRALMKDKKYAEACAAFEHSQQLDPQWGTLYNLATCYGVSGRLASAWAAYRELAQRDTNLSRRKDAAKKAKALDKRLPKLVIKAPAAPPGLVVTLDGADVTALVGSDSPIDLGDHKLHASAPARRDFDATTAITEEGKTVTVTIELLPADSRAVATRPAPSKPDPGLRPTPSASPSDAARPVDPEPVDGAPRSRRRTYGVIVAGAGGALVITGLVFGQLASGTWSDAKALCGDDLMCDDDGTLMRGNALVSSARSQANLATGLVIGGVAAIGVGAVLFLTAPRGETRPATAWRLTPAASAEAVSLTLDGRF